MRHFEWQLTKSVSLVYGPNFFVEKELDELGVSESAGFVKRVITILVTILLHLVSISLVDSIPKVFD